MLRHPDPFLTRFTAALARWRALPRHFRRRLTRRVAVSAAGAALALALVAGPLSPIAHAASIDVDDGAVMIAPDGLCSLREALSNANHDTQLFGSPGECAAGSGNDTINLPIDGDFLIEDAPYGYYIQAQGLPPIVDALTIEGNGSTIRRDTADTDQFSILAVYAAEATIKDVTISGGYGNYGGGLLAYDGADVTISGCTISNNEARVFGGGIFTFQSDISILGSTISGNSAGYIGGGMNLFGGVFSIVNSTISDNSAQYVGGLGTGLGFGSATTEGAIVNSTITGNSGEVVGGIANGDESEVTISRSLISGNTATDGGVEIYNFDYGIIITDDFNVFGHAGLSDNSAFHDFTPGANDVNATSDGANIPLNHILDTTLADNGGPTLTHNLVVGSPALDMAPDADCVAPSPTDGVDQRGATRPFDVAAQGNDGSDTCDAGAVEAEAPTSLGEATVFVSGRAAGMTGDGVAFGPHDILRWDGSAWSKWFNGDDAGLIPNGKAKHNINAFWIPDPAGSDVVMSFGQNARHVPGIVPKVDGMDLVWWDGDSQSFSLWFDGSDVDLTNKTQEKIDALHVLPGSASPIGGSCQAYLLISTQGPGKVRGHDGVSIKFGGEDVLGFCATNLGEATAGVWHLVLDGSAEGMPRNSTVSLSASDDGQTLYLTTRAAFSVDAASGNHSMVYAYDFGTGQFSGPVFVPADEGLPGTVNGLHVEGELQP